MTQGYVGCFVWFGAEIGGGATRRDTMVSNDNDNKCTVCSSSQIVEERDLVYSCIQ
jgi:hypothetical protein